MERKDNLLHDIAQNLYTLSAIPIWKISPGGKEISSLLNSDFTIPTFVAAQIRQMFSSIGSKKILLEDDPRLPLCTCLYQDEDGIFYVIGPVIYRSLLDSQKTLLEILKKKEPSRFSFPFTSYSHLTAVINLFAYAIDSHPLFLSDTITADPDDNGQNALSANLVQELVINDCEAIRNHTFPDEEFTLGLLKSGDIKAMQKHMQLYDITYPQLFADSPLKSDRYMAVSAIGIMARACIDGGVISSDSFLLSDLFIKKLDQCQTRKDIIAVRNQAFIEFTRLVHDHAHKNGGNLLIDDCEKFVAANIRKKISLQDAAIALGIDKAYLARIFSARKGLTVGQYIRKEKIKLACNLLTYSSCSIVEIAQYLGYDSQSYFGKLFLEDTGLTPNQFRMAHHSPEF